MPTVYVNDKPVEIGTEKLNCVQVAEKAGLLIPHYCYHPALTIVASCRMCLVEVGELKDGKVLMQPKVLPGCQTPVKDGTVIVTGDYHKKPSAIDPLPYDPAYKPGDRAQKAQADTLEGLLLNHPLDCPVCDKAGECKLQDYSYEFGRSESRLIDEKNQPPNKPHISSKITLFTDRCIMCTRCVRFTREISGTAELTVVSRGHHSEIDIFPGRPLENKLSGNVVDLCPVGALASKDFLYTQRVWYLKESPSVCSLCSTGCSIHVDSNKDIIYRLRPRENPKAQGYFMCDEGRWGYHYVSNPGRITRPHMKVDGKLQPVSWTELTPRIHTAFINAAQANPKKCLVVFSPYMTLEEAFLYATYFQQLSPQFRMQLGPVPVVGEDDHYPKDVRGNAVSPPKFTIHAEKCPNRRGVEAVLKHFGGSTTEFSAKDLADTDALFFIGGYPDPLAAGLFEEFSKITLPELICTTSFFSSPLSVASRFLLPATASYEREGTFVNFNGLAQSFPRAIRPPLEIRGELQLAFDLLGRRGLVQAASIRQEIAAVMPEFTALANAKVTEPGKRLALATV